MSDGVLFRRSFMSRPPPSSAKFTSETHSPSKDTEVWIGDDRHRKKKSKKEDKEKEKDKQDRLGGWAAGRRLPMTA